GPGSGRAPAAGSLRRRGRMKRLAMAALAAVWATQFSLVEPTNFTRTDEWLYLSLTSSDIVDFPPHRRPLPLLWALHGALAGHRFTGFHLADGAYLLLGGWLAFLLALRLAGDVGVAFVAGALVLVWAPRDMARLLTVQTTVNAGAACAALLALVLLVESWTRRRATLLVLAAVVAAMTVASYEAAAPMLVAGALLVPWVGGGTRPSWRW